MEEAKFPDYLVPKFKEAGFMQYMMPEPWGKPMSIGAQGMLIAEMARVEPGVATMFLVQFGLLGCTVLFLASE